MKVSAVGLVGAATFWAAAAHEQTAIAATAAPRQLVLDFRLCPAAAAPDIRNLVSVELRRPVALFGEGAAPGGAPIATIVQVTCQDLHAQIDVDDPLSGKAFPRVLDLSAAAPVARSHLLALSIVELLASRLLEIQKSPQPTKVAATTADLPGVQARAVDPQTSAGAGAEARRSLRTLAVVATQTSDGHWSRGAGAIVAGDPHPHVGWLAQFGFQRGERAFALGHVTADTASALLALLAGTSFGFTSLRAGLGARGGGAWLNGTPAASSGAVGGAVRGPWWGPVAVLDGSAVIRRRLVVEASIEGGRVFLPVVASVQGAEPVAIRGNWIGVTFGVGITL